MRTWLEFFQKKVNASQIDQLYSKANIAVEIVNMYNPKILDNISTIANLTSGAYGVYNSGENQKILPKDLEDKLIYYGRVDKRNLNVIPRRTLSQYFPQLPINQIKPSDTIHVNVRRIMKEFGNDFDAVIEISSTIIHECTHEIEKDQTGQTSEVGPVNAERKFKMWVQQNKNMLMQRFPQLQGDVIGAAGILPMGRV